MSRQRGDLGNRIRRLEAFFYHFLVYVFHAREGRTMRRWFIRDTLLRTLTYILATVPFLIILWYYHLFYGQFPTINAAEVVLVMDLAFGAAFLRTVYVYRGRVHFVFDGDEMEGKEEPPEVGGFVEEAPPPVERLDVVTEMDEENVLPEGLGAEAAGPKVDRVILECRKCKRRRTVPAAMAAPGERCACGGKIRVL